MRAGGNMCVCVLVWFVRCTIKSWAEMANLKSVKVSGCICVRAETRRGFRVREGFSSAS